MTRCHLLLCQISLAVNVPLKGTCLEWSNNAECSQCEMRVSMDLASRLVAVVDLKHRMHYLGFMHRMLIDLHGIWPTCGVWIWIPVLLFSVGGPNDKLLRSQLGRESWTLSSAISSSFWTYTLVSKPLILHDKQTLKCLKFSTKHLKLYPKLFLVVNV